MAYGKAGDWYINNNEGGGGEIWNTVFEGNVTTTDRDGFADGLIGDFMLTANSIKVTFNGTEYTCERNEDDTYGAENIVPTGYDFSEYPFCITYDGVLITPNAGTYTLKIEEPQSGGSSDFSMAKITVVNEPETEIKVPLAINVDSEKFSATGIFLSGVYDVILYGGTCIATIPDTQGGTVSVSGDLVLDENNDITITGDGTITIS